MNVRDLIPWGGNDGDRLPGLRDGDRDPFLTLHLHREVNRLFDDMFRGFGAGLPGCRPDPSPMREG